MRDWLPYKGRYLSVLLDMEAPPESSICMWCGRDGTFRCTECAYRPIFCGSCCLDAHELSPIHHIQRWTGAFFEDFSLCLVSHFFEAFHMIIDGVDWLCDVLGSRWKTMPKGWI